MTDKKEKVEKVDNPAEVQHCTGCKSEHCQGKKEAS